MGFRKKILFIFLIAGLVFGCEKEWTSVISDSESSIARLEPTPTPFLAATPGPKPTPIRITTTRVIVTATPTPQKYRLPVLDATPEPKPPPTPFPTATPGPKPPPTLFPTATPEPTKIADFYTAFGLNANFHLKYSTLDVESLKKDLPDNKHTDVFLENYGMYLAMPKIIEKDWELWICDRHVMKFDLEGNYFEMVESWVGDGTIEAYGKTKGFNGCHIEFQLDNENNFYTITFERYMIEKYGMNSSSDYQFIDKWEGKQGDDMDFTCKNNDMPVYRLEFKAFGISNGYIYTLAPKDLCGNEIKNGMLIYDTNRKLIRKWGELGEFDWDWPVIDIDHNNNFIYISNFRTSEIKKYDLNGQLLKSIGSESQEKGQFNQIQDISLDKRGNLYVLDVFDSSLYGRIARVQKFDKDGQLQGVLIPKEIIDYARGWGGSNLAGKIEIGESERLYLSFDWGAVAYTLIDENTGVPFKVNPMIYSIQNSLVKTKKSFRSFSCVSDFNLKISKIGSEKDMNIDLKWYTNDNELISSASKNYPGVIFESTLVPAGNYNGTEEERHWTVDFGLADCWTMENITKDLYGKGILVINDQEIPFVEITMQKPH